MKIPTCAVPFIAITGLLTVFSTADAGDSQTNVRYVSERVPAQGEGPRRVLSADLPAMPTPSPPAPSRATPARGPINDWQHLTTLDGVVIDMSFPTATVGYAAAELGRVWKTTDGGESWIIVMDLGFPHYWYGVHALNENDVIVTGFHNADGTGIMRWTHDGGETWTDDMILNEEAWSYGVRFADDLTGLVLDGQPVAGQGTHAHFTTTGGTSEADWTSVVIDPEGGWFARPFSLLPSGGARASGIKYCDSVDAGANWSCRPSIDSVFDGGVFFLDDDIHGWVGGGSISPQVAGWVHSTTDGGETWTEERILEAAWPIRTLLFVTPETGWAAGGNHFSDVGGIYATEDGGETWVLDEDTGHETNTCARAGSRVLCSGFNLVGGQWESAIHALDLDTGAPTIAVEPDSFAVTLQEGDATDELLAISNLGDEPLTWEIETAAPASLEDISRRGAVDCDNDPDIILHDDGTIENGYSVPTVDLELALVDRFTPSAYPATFTAVCVSFVSLGPTSLDFELVVLDDDGPDGSPSTELAFLPVSASDIPVITPPPIPSTPVWHGFDLSSLNLSIDSGSVFIGVRWVPSEPDVFLTVDESPGNPVGFAGGYFWTATAGAWNKTQNRFLNYRSLFVRAVEGGSSCDEPTEVEWLSVDPPSGATPAGGTSEVTVSIDSSGLAPGDYEAVLCIENNDPLSPVVAVPVDLTVTPSTAEPIADISPESLAFEVASGDSDTQTLNMGNIGTADLVWSIEEAEGDAGAAPTTTSASGHSTGRGAPVGVAHSLPPRVEQALAYDRERHLDTSGQRVRGVLPAPTAIAPAGGAGTGGTAAWSSLGPPGGDVFDVAVSPLDPDLALAGIAPSGGFGGTLYRSTDAGSTWSEMAALSGTSVYDIEFATAGKAYIGTQAGVWESSDGGVTWAAQDLGLLVSQVFDVTVDPSDPAILWAGMNGLDSDLAEVALMRSTDAGVTWTDETPPFSASLDGTGVAIDPNDSNTLVAIFSGSSSGGQVWVTTDGGTTWTDRSSGLPGNPLNAVVYDGTRVLVGGGLRFGSQFLGLYQSTDLGANWAALHDGTWPLLVVEGIAVDPNDTDTILVATDGAGVNRTHDGGASWQIGIGGSEALAARSLRFRPQSSQELFLGTSSQAVFLSTDGGDTFVASADGISELDLYSVDANPLAANEIAIAFQGQNDGGVYSSLDGGATWELEPLPPTRFSAVGFAPGGTLYAISSGPTTVAEEGLYRRESDGTWIALGPDQGSAFESDLAALRFSLNDPDWILVGGADFGVADSEPTIWRTLDGGQTWTKVFEGAVDSNADVTDFEIVEDGSDQQMIASVTSLAAQQGGILRSVDGGTSWSPSSSGLPTEFLRGTRLCASPSDPQVFFLSAWLSADSGGLFRTDDGGVTWASTGWSGSATVLDVACHPVDTQMLYVTQSSGDVVMRSEDQGVTFSPFSDGVEGVATPRELAFAGASRLLLASGKGSYATDLEGGGGACASPVDVPWLSAAPDAGTTPPAGSVPVDITADATGLDPGTYTAQLCVTTNDPEAPLVAVPVTLTVAGEGVAELTFVPPGLDFGEVEVGTTSPPQSAMLENTGDLDLTGILFEMPGGGFVANTSACGPELAAGEMCAVSVTFTPGEPGTAEATLEVTSDQDASASLGLIGQGVGEEGFTAMALEVDPDELSSDGNEVFEPGELVEVAPAWRNDGTTPQSLSGDASDLTGPEGATYTLAHDDADYGTLDPGQTASCLETGVCYQVSVDDPAVRPAPHWEATFDETLDDSDGTTKTWTLHIGESFVDVPSSNLFYSPVETLLHHGITGGCTGTEYCPTASNTRDQIPVFVLRALEGADYEPPACVEGDEVFDDVPAGNVFCPWIEELANRGVVSGCGGDNYCPNAPVTRAQMAIFLLRTLEGSDYEPPACTGMFVDVPCPSLFADWIEDLFARGITGGCGSEPLRYCPSSPVNREQMAAFIGKAFELTLYGP